MDTDTNTPAETGATETEYVKVEEASDEDLTSFLDGVKNGTYSEDGVVQSGPTSTETDEASTEEAAPVEETSEEETPKEEPQQEDRVTLSRSELEEILNRSKKQEQDNRQKEEFIQSLKGKLGQARQDAQSYKAQLEKRLQETDSPIDAHKTLLEIDKIDTHIQGINAEENRIERTRTTFQTVTKAVKLDEIPIEDVAETLHEDGLNQQQIAAFIQNPWEADPAALVQFFKRAKDRTDLKRHKKALNDLVPLTRELIAKLKEQDKKPERLMNEVSRVMKNGPSINAGSGTSSSKRSLADVDVTKLSTEDLDRAWEETKSSLRR